jgi:hypothetical protein
MDFGRASAKLFEIKRFIRNASLLFGHDTEPLSKIHFQTLDDPASSP